VGDNTYSFDRYGKALAAWIVPGIALCAGAYAANKARYWHYREFWSVALLTLVIVVVPAVRWVVPAVIVVAAAVIVVVPAVRWPPAALVPAACAGCRTRASMAARQLHVEAPVWGLGS
jgi:hypothetical protein